MGMRPCDFEDMTPVEFLYAWMGYSRKKQDEQRQQWERTRWEVWTLTCIQLEPKDRKPMTVMFPLAWDKPESLPKSTELTMAERQERVKKILQECAPDKAQ